MGLMGHVISNFGELGDQVYFWALGFTFKSGD